MGGIIGSVEFESFIVSRKIYFKQVVSIYHINEKTK